MEIKYSRHIRDHLRLRKIAYSLPKRIVEQSDEICFDVETGSLIAVDFVELYGKNREVMELVAQTFAVIARRPKADVAIP